MLSLRYHNGEEVKLPVGLYIIHEAAMTRELLKEIRIDFTGLGHDLGGSIPWHICLRSDAVWFSFYGRTSLGALLSMMTNVALKSELLVESWA